MSSNKNRGSGFRLRIKNERLTRRVSVSFSAIFLTVTTVVLFLAVAICVLLLMSINKDHFEQFNQQIVNAIYQNQELILAQENADRLNFAYENYVLPVSNEKREVSIRINDDYASKTNDNSFQDVFSVLSINEKQQSTVNDLNVQQSKNVKDKYYFIQLDIPLNGYTIHLSAYENINDYYVYTLILSIAIGSALLIIVIVMFSLGRFTAKRALAPLQVIADAVKNITEENLATKINPIPNENEVDSLIIELNGMLRRLNEAFEEQKRFVSDVSHELRIPITIIQGYVDIIQTWGKDDEKLLVESLDSISAETSNMKFLVEKLLLPQTLGSGNYNFDLEKIDVNLYLQKAIFETKLLTQQHEIIGELSELTAFVLTDRSLLSQAIRSIVDNSIKYTNAGGSIRIGSRYNTHKVFISIKDSGCGIPKEYIQRVKERFFRVDSARNKNTGGSGLGLSIVNACIMALGGELVINSELGKGSEFIIVLPRYNFIKF